MTDILADLASLVAVAGLAHQVIGSALVPQITAAMAQAPIALPPVSLLKPLYGSEPLLETALESCFVLDYPALQLVFGVADPADPALAIIERLRARYPEVDTTIVIGPDPLGPNRKIGNLINMLPAVKHDVLVISDADMHVPAHYLKAVVASLAETGTGLVTSLYTGLPATSRLPALLGAAQINHAFLPGAALARRLGRQDCFGATMALHRDQLEAIGGLGSLVSYLADDNVLGHLILDSGKKIGLAPVLPATSVVEQDLRELAHHELRWARTIRALVPAVYPSLVLQFPLFWAALGLLLSGFPTSGWALALTAVVIRYAAARRLERQLDVSRVATPWLLLIRDFFSAFVFVASYFSDTVEWRGYQLQADHGKPASGVLLH